MTKVLIAEDQRLLRESFKNIIENNSDITVVGCVTNGNEAYHFCKNSLPDLILMDISMPDCDGIKATKLIKSNYPHVKILILTASNDECDVLEAIKNGADGYILKDIGSSELILAIKSIIAGLAIVQKEILTSIPVQSKHNRHDNLMINVDGINVILSEKELQILKLIIDGNNNKQIAAELFMAEGTIKNKVTEMISKLHLKDRTQLAVYAIKNNLV